MATLYRRSGVYYIDCRYEGKRVRVSTGSSNKTVAEQVRKKVETEIALGKFDANANTQIILLEPFFTEYFEKGVSHKKVTTLKNERHYAKVFTKTLGNVSLKEIDTRMLDTWKTTVLNTYSPTSYNIMFRALKTAFNKAVQWKYLELNPFSMLTKIRVDETRLYLSEEEIRKIFQLLNEDMANPLKRHLKKTNQMYKLLFEFLLLTGLRREEALSLDSSKVDMENEVLFIEKTKGKTFRNIPMHTRVKEIVQELGTDLFRNIVPSSASHKFSSLCKRAGFTGKFKLHSLRHTFATDLNTNEVDIARIQSLLGHADIRTTLIYSKTTLDTLRKDINKLKAQ